MLKVHLRTYIRTQLLGFQKPLRTFILFVFEAKGVLSSSVCAYIQLRLDKACKKAGHGYSKLLLHNFIYSKHNQNKVIDHMIFPGGWKALNSGTLCDGRSDICNFVAVVFAINEERE
jgi:hypothetical protein